MLEKIKYFVKNFFIKLIFDLRFPLKKNKPKSILLIRLDAIGDYVLFRNYIKILKTNSKYIDYSITLVGNIAWKELSEKLDSNYIDEFVWIDRNKFTKSFAYKYSILKNISKNNYRLIINPVYSREFKYSDFIVNVIHGEEKIGSVGDFANISQVKKEISDKYYTKLIPATNKILFEFFRNKEFFEYLLNIKIDIQKPEINLDSDVKLSEKKYAVLFIGASAKFRKWNIKNFAEVGQFIKNKFDYEIVLCGASNDIEDEKQFSEIASYKYINLVGRTSLMEILQVL